LARTTVSTGLLDVVEDPDEVGGVVDVNGQQTMTVAKEGLPERIVARRKHAHSIPRTLVEIRGPAGNGIAGILGKSWN
jgi:hypothetical protein